MMEYQAGQNLHCKLCVVPWLLVYVCVLVGKIL